MRACGPVPAALAPDGTRWFLEHVEGRIEPRQWIAVNPLILKEEITPRFREKTVGGAAELQDGMRALRASFQAYKRRDDPTFTHTFVRGALF